MTNMRNIWEPVAELENMEDCKNYIKGGQLKDANGNPLHFRWHTKTPGDGQHKAMFQCISHQHCAYLAKAVYSSGTYWVKVTSGVEHTPILAKTRRSNACATSQQWHDVKLLINAGAKPASIVSTLTSVELKRCKELGEDAPKRPQGGLEGKQYC